MILETIKPKHNKLSHEGYLGKIHSLAHRRGGLCYSYKIENQNQKLLLECAKGHQWRASATSVLYSKSWCPICAGNQALTIDEMNDIAKDRGGKCLSKSYINSKTKLQWQCAEGHTWQATPFSIKNRKSWCPVCYKINNN